VWPPPCTGGNEAHGVLAKLDSEDGGKQPERDHIGDPLARGEGLRACESIFVRDSNGN